MPVFSTAEIIRNVFRTPILRVICLVTFAASLSIPTYGIFHVMPSLSQLLIGNIEDEAQRTANHLTVLFFQLVANSAISPDELVVHQEIERVQVDLGIEKIKVFTADGTIVYSSKSTDVGKLNTKDYFHQIVAQGEIYSKVVPKNSKTMEGRLVALDVAEVYIPVIQDGVFQGAFEIYYDITEKKKALNSLLFRSRLVVGGTALTIMMLLAIVLMRASKANLLQRDAEQLLQAERDMLEERVADQLDEIKITQKTSIEALAILAEYHDHDTGGHLERIHQYVLLLVQDMAEGCPYSAYMTAREKYCEELALASILHDIGKTAIPSKILTKPGRLTDEEFEVVKTHTTIAGELLAKANAAFETFFQKDSYLALARDIALYHHEKWNGQGYPAGLSGEDIPLSARIVALVDVYDALRSVRPYKKPWSHEAAVAEILQGKGEHFDPVVVDAFMAVAQDFEAISRQKESLTANSSQYLATR